MSAILSSANNLALSVLRTNDTDLLKTQSNIASGKEVNTAADDPVRYFRSLDLTRRAARLADVSKNIDLASTALKAADGAMSTMRSSLDTLMKTINEARGTASAVGNTNAAPITMTGRAFSATSSSATKIGGALATAAEVTATGKSLQNIARNKQLFDKDTNTANNAATAISDGNLGIASPGGNNPRMNVRLSFWNGGATPPAAANLDIAIPTTVNGRDATVGDLVDTINAQVKNTIFQNFSANITADGKLRISSGSTQAFSVSMVASNDANFPGAAGNGSANGALGFAGGDAAAVTAVAPGAIVAGNPASASAYDASMLGTGTNQFQEGDTFTMALTDRTGNTRAVTFQAVSAANRTPVDATQGTSANPIKFNTIGDLADSINARFGSVGTEGRILVDLVNAGATNATATSALKLTLSDPTASLSITQTKNVDSSNFSVANNGGPPVRTLLANDLSAIFGGIGVQSTNIDSTLTDVVVGSEVQYRERQQLASLNFSAPAGSNAANDAKRQAAAEAYKGTLNMLSRVYSDSKITTAGMPNLLNQETLKVNLGTSTTYDITVNAKLDNASLGLGTANNLPSFSTDAEVDTYTTTISNAISTITTQQGLLAQHSVALKGYQGFVDSMSTLNQNYADDITRADVNAESNKLKALQTMQQMVQAMMSINNSMEGGATRLLY